ncbi:MAG: PAS domain-containing protein, partial [Lachnospiraceae bacterium]
MGMLKVDGILSEIETVIENTLGGIGVFEVRNGKLTPVFLNNGFYRMLGYTKEECAVFLRDIESNIILEDREAFHQAITDILKDDGWSEVEFKTVTKEGGIRWLQVRGNLLSRSGESSLITTIILDVTERKNIEIELAEQAERLHLLSEAEGEMIFDYNAKTDVLVIKPAKSIGGSDMLFTDYIQKNSHENIYEEDRKLYFEMFSSILKKPQRDAVDVRASFFDRGIRWYRVNFTSILGTEGYVTRAVGRIIDIHEKKLKELEIEARAERDPLTGLYNKGTTKEMVEAALQDAAGKNTINALMMVDLDNFKAVNDTLGHAAG